MTGVSDALADDMRELNERAAEHNAQMREVEVKILRAFQPGDVIVIECDHEITDADAKRISDLVERAGIKALVFGPGMHVVSKEETKRNQVSAQVLPPKEPSPEWLSRARLEGRAEFLAMLLEENPESFANEYIGEHAIGDTGDYDQHWETQKLAQLFEVDECASSLIDRLNSIYWDQRQELDELRAELREERERLDWLTINAQFIRYNSDLGGFVYEAVFGQSRVLVKDQTMRACIDRARKLEQEILSHDASLKAKAVES